MAVVAADGGVAHFEAVAPRAVWAILQPHHAHGSKMQRSVRPTAILPAKANRSAPRKLVPITGPSGSILFRR